jgi:hypothetical protein
MASADARAEVERITSDILTDQSMAEGGPQS